MDIAVIAGYDVCAHRNPEHVGYIKSSFERARREGVEYILLIGGKTNPKYVTLSEAEANWKILDTFSQDGFWPKIVVLPFGNTAAEGLIAAKRWIMKNLGSVETLFLCAEQSRLANFMADAQQVCLLDCSRNIVAYGHPFEESKKNFSAERKKTWLHYFSHRHWFWRRIRLILQKRHQKRMSEKSKKSKEVKKILRGIGFNY